MVVKKVFYIVARTIMGCPHAFNYKWMHVVNHHKELYDRFQTDKKTPARRAETLLAGYNGWVN